MSKTTNIAAYFFALCSIFTLPIVFAGPNTVQIGFSCPDVSGTGNNSLSNFGNLIAGFGKESMNSVPFPNPPFFTYYFSSGNFPINIAAGGYSNAGVQYSSTTAVVTCKYTSSLHFDAINVTYQMFNGFGGIVQSQDAATIVIQQFIGFTDTAPIYP